MNEQGKYFSQIQIRDWNQLYDEYAPFLYGIALRILKNENQASLVLEKTFLHFAKIRNNSASESTGALLTGLVRKFAGEITANTSSSEIPAPTNSVYLAESSKINPEQFDHGYPGSVIQSANPATISMNNIHHKILDLVFYGLVNTRNAANTLGLPESVVRQLLRDALLEIRNESDSPAWK